MDRNLKAFGVALATVFAMSAMVASAVSATSFTAASTPATITANQSTTHKLTVTGVGITCTTASFHGEIKSSPTESVTITPTYTGCTTDTLGLSAKVTGFGHYGEEKTCDYVLYAAGTADLVCAAGAEVVITAGTCSVKIPAQKGLSSIAYENGVSDINASINITNISGTHTDGFGCPFSSSGSFSNGTLTGTSTVIAKNSLGATISIDWGKPSVASFTAPTSDTTIVAGQTTEHKLTVTGVGVTCTTASFHGVSGGTNVSSLTITPTYTGCTTDTLGLSTKITGFGHHGEEKTCHYVFHAAGTVDLVCDQGAEASFTCGTCSFRLPPQKDWGTVSYSNGSTDISVTLNITNISGTHTDGFGCPYASSGSFNNGTLSGSSTMAGQNSEGNPVSLAWDK